MSRKIILYGGDAVMTFTPKQHRYRVNGKPIYSFSTYSGIIDKPALIPWAVNFMEEYIGGEQDEETGEWITEPQWEAGKSYDRVQISNILEAGKKSRFSKQRKALSIGSLAHGWLQRYIIAKIEGRKHTEDMPLNPDACYSINSFLEWESERDIEYIASERRVCSLKHWYAGTLDVLARINKGDIEIWDFKTSKDVFESNVMQLGTYACALNEEREHVLDKPDIHPDSLFVPDKPITKGKVLRIPKDGGDIDVYPVEDCLEEQHEAFLHTIPLFNWSRKWKNILKKRHDIPEVA